jgi:hypothetical protein
MKASVALNIVQEEYRHIDHAPMRPIPVQLDDWL